MYINGATPASGSDWTAGVNTNVLLPLPTPSRSTTFGEDSDGEIYVGLANGRVYRLIVPSPTTSSPTSQPSFSSAPTTTANPSAEPIGSPTGSPISVGASCPSSHDQTRVLDVAGLLVLHYSIVPDVGSDFGGLFCAELVYENQGSDSWIGLGISGCPPSDFENNSCSQKTMVGGEAVIGRPNDSADPKKYSLAGTTASAVNVLAASDQTLMSPSLTYTNAGFR